MMETVVIGVGNAFRGDDGVGREVARRLAPRARAGIAVRESSGEALSLMELWSGAARVILVDATAAGGKPGAVLRMDASAAALPAECFHKSTHAFSVAEAIEMARALGELPGVVIVYGIEGVSFGHGAGLSAEAESGAAEAVRRILMELTATKT